MPPDPSLLPEELRTRLEEERKKNPPPPPKPEHFKMYVPKPEEEDVEVIEVDEGDVEDVLKDEPSLSKLLFRASALFDGMKAKLFHPRESEPSPKLPPQFFKPSPHDKKLPGLVPIAGAKPSAPSSPPAGGPSAPPPTTKARIMPAAAAPRRVRVIKRVRKPVRVSFIDETDVRNAIDIPRRRFTLITMAFVFLVLLGGGYVLLIWHGQQADANLKDVRDQIATVRARTQERQKTWAAFQDLEPRLKALATLLDGHVAPTKIFDAIEKNTVPQVSYSSFTLSPEGRVTLSARASSFETAAQQIVAFRRSGIASAVDATGYQATYDAETGELEAVTFQINLTLEPGALKAQSARVADGT